MARYLIVGGVAGGAGTAARLRRRDEKAEIIMFERGQYISYANCGLPYYAGNVITERSRLFVMTPERFKETLDVEARVLSEVVSINREAKSIHIRNLKDNSEYDERYDTLILSPGASPIKPPIPGIDHPSIMSLRSVTDIDHIKEKIDQPSTKRAVVVGGGFIGLEMAENLKERGLEVSVVEALEQVMNIIDYDLAAEVQQHLRAKGVNLYLRDGVKSFGSHDSLVSVELSSGTIIDADLVILSIGVRPDTAFLKKAGIELAGNGAIKVDEYFTTNDKNIRAVGDAIEFTSPLTKLPITVPLAGPANKQARLCADNIIDGNTRPYGGTIATSIAKIFEMTVASTGLTEKSLVKAGLPFRCAVTHAGSHAGYYPNSSQITLKVLYHPETGKIWGAQAVGYDGIDKRIDVISAFIGKDGTIADLAEFEQAYAPPFSSAKDPTNMVGFIAENVLNGYSNTITWEEAEKMRLEGAFILDVRTQEEYDLGRIEGSHLIPNFDLRNRLNEVPKDRKIVVHCAIGLRGYLAERILRQNGYTEVYNMTGGMKTYEVAMRERHLLENKELNTVKIQKNVNVLNEDGSFRKAAVNKIFKVDACGLQCPGPIIRLKREIDNLEHGDRLFIKASDPGFGVDVQAWCDLTGNELVSLNTTAGIIEAVISKGDPAVCSLPDSYGTKPAICDPDNGATMIVFSNDLDKALASFVLANGAAATGKEVTMFFTFWGLSVLRKKPAGRVKKDFMGKMFSAMLPKGMDDLGLSSMNMGGMGAAMMKGRMKKKNVDQVRQMYEDARKAGIHMIACQMSMDIMGITREELLDGVEIGGVATYMGAASRSKVNLFI
ncbi:FAD-dependent oxidoreductase [Sphaerochaeta sp. PS]|uniref:FAD-dependent oxidoreductase n=1 Tax=Sphaerochaeta sp. PS TaxID=3076336 RepID=UPI0028A2F3AE|nr:FAD-dependent oxidoreductase [Sphaerochaeta sp. PS]MDT4762708.1 FAD-dependent oxidoreductase [Sphaerochaeta sp. PS]